MWKIPKLLGFSTQLKHDLISQCHFMQTKVEKIWDSNLQQWTIFRACLKLNWIWSSQMLEGAVIEKTSSWNFPETKYKKKK